VKRRKTTPFSVFVKNIQYNKRNRREEEKEEKKK